jgi:hypothetical protein
MTKLVIWTAPDGRQPQYDNVEDRNDPHLARSLYEAVADILEGQPFALLVTQSGVWAWPSHGGMLWLFFGFNRIASEDVIYLLHSAILDVESDDPLEGDIAVAEQRWLALK